MLKFVSENELNNTERKYLKTAIKYFNCGFSEFDNFLIKEKETWEKNYSGITYYLINDEKSLKDDIIYAYATISTMGLLNQSNYDDTIINKYLTSLEIRLFAIRNDFRGKRDRDNILYSNIFFKLLLDKIYEISTKIVSFKSIFLLANEFGKGVYSKFGFIEISDYIIPSEEDKVDIKGCVPMLCLIDDDLLYKLYS